MHHEFEMAVGPCKVRIINQYNDKIQDAITFAIQVEKQLYYILTSQQIIHCSLIFYFLKQ